MQDGQTIGMTSKRRDDEGADADVADDVDAALKADDEDVDEDAQSELWKRLLLMLMRT